MPFPRFIEILSVLTVRKLKMTSSVPRDPLGLRHSRPSGFDLRQLVASALKMTGAGGCVSTYSLVLAQGVFRRTLQFSAFTRFMGV